MDNRELIVRIFLGSEDLLNNYAELLRISHPGGDIQSEYPRTLTILAGKIPQSPLLDLLESKNKDLAPYKQVAKSEPSFINKIFRSFNFTSTGNMLVVGNEMGTVPSFSSVSAIPVAPPMPQKMSAIPVAPAMSAIPVALPMPQRTAAKQDDMLEELQLKLKKRKSGEDVPNPVPDVRKRIRKTLDIT